MSLIDEVLNDPFYRALAESVSDEGQEHLEDSVRDLLKHIDQVYTMVIDASASESGREKLAAAIEHNISPEGIDSWLETN